MNSKREILRQATKFASDEINCMDCIGPGGLNSPSQNDLAKLTSALQQIGIDKEQLACLDKLLGIDLSGTKFGHPSFLGCISKDHFEQAILLFMSGSRDGLKEKSLKIAMSLRP